MFLVERVTPGQLRDHFNEGADRALRSALPFDVEIEDEPEPRGEYKSTCQCQSVFRLTDIAVAKLKRLGLFREGLRGRSNPCVCLCMGKTLDQSVREYKSRT